MFLSMPTPNRVEPSREAQLDIGDGRGVGARAHGMLAIIGDIEVEAGLAPQRIDEAVDRPVAVALDGRLDAVVADHGDEVCGRRPRLGSRCET